MQDTKAQQAFSTLTSDAMANVIEQAPAGSAGLVIFRKANGELRKLKFVTGNGNQHVRGTARGKLASETFHMNNPWLIRVRDVELSALHGGCKAWRTVDLRKVLVLAIEGQLYVTPEGAVLAMLHEALD
jgi:hypothetical protein